MALATTQVLVVIGYSVKGKRPQAETNSLCLTEEQPIEAIEKPIAITCSYIDSYMLKYKVLKHCNQIKV